MRSSLLGLEYDVAVNGDDIKADLRYELAQNRTDQLLAEHPDLLIALEAAADELGIDASIIDGKIQADEEDGLFVADWTGDRLELKVSTAKEALMMLHQQHAELGFSVDNQSSVVGMLERLHDHYVRAAGDALPLGEDPLIGDPIETLWLDDSRRGLQEIYYQ